MENYIGEICPFCKAEIKEGDAVKVCPVCNVPHHEGCWEENKGCTTTGCSEQHREAQGAEQTAEQGTLCSNCGNTLSDDHDFCPSCGAPKDTPQKNICGKCGTELQDGQEFCPKCGQKAGSVKTGSNKKKKLLAIIGIAVAAIAVIVVVLILIFGNKGPNFEKLYDKFCSSIWADVGYDGSYLSIDTNPYDEDDDGLAYPDAFLAITEVNEALGLPESLINEMGSTTGADGKQSETFAEKGIVVTWKYHPDLGLEVIYKKMN